jgi:PAS domain S-box-containing protein
MGRDSRTKQQLLQEIAELRNRPPDCNRGPDPVYAGAADADVERRVAERTHDLQQKVEAFLSLSENSPDAVTRLDVGLRHLYVNPAARKIAGVDASGKTWREAAFPDAYIEFWEYRVNRVVQTGKTEVIENRFQSPDGTSYDLLSRITPEFDQSGRVRSILIVSSDITQRKRVEEALRRHSADLTAANHNLEAFSYSITHDLRNPLHSILACSEVAKVSIPPEDRDGRIALDHIITSAKRMGQVIADLMSLTTITRQEVRLTRCNLSEIAQSIIEELSTLDPERKVNCIIEPGLLAEADEGLIWILMQNLFHNAWKFSAKTESAQIEFGRNRYEKSHVFYVRDNGAGFNMAAIERLFKPFQRLHPQKEYSGTGIGLTIVKRIIEKHGGTVWAESEPGKGASFYFVLPGDDK